MDAQINLMEQVPSVQSLLSVKRPVRKGPAYDKDLQLLEVHGKETMNYHGSEVCAHIGKSSQSFGCASILSSSVVDTNQ